MFREQHNWNIIQPIEILPDFMSTRSTGPYLEKRRSNSDWRVSYPKFPTNIGLILANLTLIGNTKTWVIRYQSNQIRKQTIIKMNNQPTVLIFQFFSFFFTFFDLFSSIFSCFAYSTKLCTLSLNSLRLFLTFLGSKHKETWVLYDERY